MALEFFSPEDAIYNTALLVLFLVEYLGRSASVELAAVNRAALLDIGGNLHLE